MTVELSPEQEARQLKLLTEVRNRHHAHLVRSGVARRILDAEVPITYAKDASEFTEGTLLYPVRRYVAETAIGILWGGVATISGSCSQAPQDINEWRDFMDKHVKSDVITLGRLEARQTGYSQTHIITGLQIERSNPDAGVLSMDGIDTADVLELAELLKEVEARKASGELSCLEEESLTNLSIGRHGPVPLP